MPALNQNIYQFTEKVHGDGRYIRYIICIIADRDKVYPWITNAIEDSALDKTVLVTGGGRGIGKVAGSCMSSENVSFNNHRLLLRNSPPPEPKRSLSLLAQ